MRAICLYGNPYINGVSLRVLVFLFISLSDIHFAIVYYCKRIVYCNKSLLLLKEFKGRSFEYPNPAPDLLVVVYMH